MNSDTLASAEVTSALKELESSSSPSTSSPGYTQLLSKIISTSTPETLGPNLIAYLESILRDSLGIITSRPLLGSFVHQFATVEDPDVKIEVGQRALQLLRPKVVSYEEQDTEIKKILADAYEAQESYTESARILQTITLDSSQRNISPDDKAKIWIRIVRCYLEEEDPIFATAYLNRVKNVFHEVKNKETQVYFQLSQARILDSNRSFLEASRAYHHISQLATVLEDDRLQALSAAIICAVLAPAGPKRSRMLASLYKDDRSVTLEEHGILEKMFLNQLLHPDEVQAFSKKLSPHHLAKTADGSTVLDKAVLEHNLLGASRLYQNIGTAELGDLLGVEAEKAEEYARQMIEQGRVAGYIDQIDQRIFFEGEASGEKKTAHKARDVGTELRVWDANVQGLMEEVEKVTTMIQTHNPGFYEANMVS